MTIDELETYILLRKTSRLDILYRHFYYVLDEDRSRKHQVYTIFNYDSPVGKLFKHNKNLYFMISYYDVKLAELYWIINDELVITENASELYREICDKHGYHHDCYTKF